MKRWLLAVALLSPLVVTAQTVDPWSVASVALTVGKWINLNSNRVYYVQVEATANTPEAARQAAFRKATELAVGTLVLGESESDGKHLIRNDVVTYSSGFVDDYKVISETPVGDKHRVVMDVWVSDSKIANRLSTMGRGEGSAVNGAAIEKDWNSAKSKAQSELDARKVMQTVLKDYPRAAYTVKVLGTEVKRYDGRLGFTVDTEITMSKEYIQALQETVKRTKQGSWATGRRGVDVSNGLFDYERGNWVDPTVQKMWVETFQQDIAMQVSFDGNGAFNQCWDQVKPELDGSFFGWNSTDTRGYNRDESFYVVRGNATKRLKFTVINHPGWNWSDDRFIKWASNLTSVSAKIIPGSKCI